MSKYFVHNRETDKVHIFTGGKAAWMESPSDLRDHVKRYCTFSRTGECWMSKAKGGIWWKDKLIAAGFEDRGTEGQRLSFAEQIEQQQERAESKADRYEEHAHNAQSRSAAAFKTSHTMMSAIPMGQPILVGHYSEGRDRRYRDRAWNLLGRGVHEEEKSRYFAGRAATARATAEGSNYSNPAYLGRRINEAEKDLRDIERKLEKYSGPEYAEYRERLADLQARAIDKLSTLEELLEQTGSVTFTRESLRDKKEVRLSKWGWSTIVRLNPKTVSVPNICYPNANDQARFALKYDYCEVLDAR